ncbi:MAG TPA: hypothetical protein VMC61_05765 [Methanocella sp.]|nr:hypothetical protein [Methanocella sp.]
MDSAEELTGYDEVDADQVFNGGYLSDNNPPTEGRRRGKKSLSPRGTARPRPKRSAGITGIFSSGFRHFEDTAKAMLAVSIGALVLCGIILYFTNKMQPPFNFYGALAASVVVMALLFYTASRLAGGSR